MVNYVYNLCLYVWIQHVCLTNTDFALVYRSHRILAFSSKKTEFYISFKLSPSETIGMKCETPFSRMAPMLSDEINYNKLLSCL